MIIVNQDKNKIVNFERIVSIWIDNPLNNDEGNFEIIAETDGMSIWLGEYKKEKRAKEVLKLICYFYNSNQRMFEMPED